MMAPLMKLEMPSIVKTISRRVRRLSGVDYHQSREAPGHGRDSLVGSQDGSSIGD
jgi:hypothetical protein